MGIQQINLSDINKYSVERLGLNPNSYNLFSVEAIAASLRRVASLLCPCPQRALVESLLEVLNGLTEDKNETKILIKDILEGLISYGDIWEGFEESSFGVSNNLLYLTPPSFIWRDSGLILLLGITPDRNSYLPQGLETRVEYIKHTRRIKEQSGENLKLILKDLGLVELSMRAWRKEPSYETPFEYISKMSNKLLDQTGYLSTLKIIDPNQPVTYYRNRWKVVENQTGRFIGRRPQSYGNDIWCFVELEKGKLVKMLELPTLNSKLRGCDEAWRLQAAIDATRNNHQQFRVNYEFEKNYVTVDFFSPVPYWAQRRWNIIGEPVDKSKGCLFSYKFPRTEIEQEIVFIEKYLWLSKHKKST
jgi:hypothetical protein